MEGIQDGMVHVMKRSFFDAYEDMDQDIPSVPEDFKELQRYKESRQFRERKVNAEVLEAWVKRWPGQSTFLCSQIWFTQKVNTVFAGAIIRLHKVNEDKNTK